MKQAKIASKQSFSLMLSLTLFALVTPRVLHAESAVWLHMLAGIPMKDGKMTIKGIEFTEVATGGPSQPLKAVRETGRRLVDVNRGSFSMSVQKGKTYLFWSTGYSNIGLETSASPDQLIKSGFISKDSKVKFNTNFALLPHMGFFGGLFNVGENYPLNRAYGAKGQFSGYVKNQVDSVPAVKEGYFWLNNKKLESSTRSFANNNDTDSRVRAMAANVRMPNK